jgi:hypothetical protein
MGPGKMRIMKAVRELNKTTFEEIHGHKPFFELTAEGAMALKAFFAQNGVTNSNKIEEDLFKRFLRENMQLEITPGANHPIPKLLSNLFGSALPSVQSQSEALQIDFDLLNYVADPEKNAVVMIPRNESLGRQF